MNNLTILINSCDKYEDAWDPFFKILKTQWPECENYSIVLNTETKIYNCNYLNVKNICGGKEKTWSQRLKYTLNQIDSDYILYFFRRFFSFGKG